MVERGPETVRGREGIRDAYRGPETAREYLEHRFREPLGALLHARQTAVLSGAVARLQPRRILEIAPGPARLSTEISLRGEASGVLAEANLPMLKLARERLRGTGATAWRFACTDAFALPFVGAFDLAYSFRLLRHFEDDDRAHLYRQVGRALRPGGYFLFDAVNERVSAPLRARAGPKEYPIYDALLRPETLRAELERAGFELLRLDGVQRRFSLLRRIQILLAPRSRFLAAAVLRAVDRWGGGEPLEWVVTCRRG